MPSVLDQPTSFPHVRAMWAIIRLVVVLPLVPVTATTGIRGVIVCGRVASGAAATRGRGPADSLLDVAAGQLVEHRRRRPGPSPGRASRCRHG